MTQRDVMGREVGGGFMFGNACTPVVDSCQCVAKPIQYCKLKYRKKIIKKKKERKCTINAGSPGGASGIEPACQCR